MCDSRSMSIDGILGSCGLGEDEAVDVPLRHTQSEPARTTAYVANPLFSMTPLRECRPVSYMEDNRATNAPSRRWTDACTRKLVVHPAWVATQILAVVFDFVSLVASVGCIQTFAVCVFCFDVWVRIGGFGPALFLKRKDQMFDATIVTLSFAMTVVSIFVSAGRLVRCLDVVRVVRMTLRTYYASQTCMRHITGRDKARFIDPALDIDLDLVYVTPRLIGMSVPASNFTALYRNPLHQVVHFFETFHHRRYLIVNACPEVPYPEDAFSTGSVTHVDVRDHMPPTLSQVVDFLVLAQRWLSQHHRNVLAVHCRGGKGRTGTLCAAWLLYDREVECATTAAKVFANTRTDVHAWTGKLASKVQGVETPSQVRFIEYVDRMLRDQGAYRPVPVVLPPPRFVRLVSLTLHNVFRKPPPVDDVVVFVHDCENDFSALPSPKLEGRSWVFDLRHSVEGDFRINVALRGAAEVGAAKWRGNTVRAGSEPGCLFYFVAHTAFLAEEEFMLPIFLVDKACKKPQRYSVMGRVVLRFEDIPDAGSCRLAPSGSVSLHKEPL